MSNAAVSPPRKPGLRERMAPALVGATVTAGAIVLSQAVSFAWPYDDESNSVRFLQKHAILLALAGIALLMIGNAMHSLMRRVSDLERQLADGTRSKAP